jgi:hypothetical protein
MATLHTGKVTATRTWQVFADKKLEIRAPKQASIHSTLHITHLTEHHIVDFASHKMPNGFLFRPPK